MHQTEDTSRLSAVVKNVYPSVDELAADLNISRQSAYAGLRNGTIPSIRLGKRFIIPRAAIQQWLTSAGKTAA